MNEHLRANLRFYGPSLLALFAAMPGNISFLLSPIQGDFAIFILNLLFLFVFIAVLLSPWRYTQKMMAGAAVFFCFLFISIGILRDQTPELSVVSMIFDLPTFHGMLPTLLLYFALCQLDRRRRSYATVGIVSGLSFVAGVLSVLTANTYGDARWLSLKDLQLRVVSNNWASPQDLLEHCHHALRMEEHYRCPTILAGVLPPTNPRPEVPLEDLVEDSAPIRALATVPRLVQ